MQMLIGLVVTTFVALVLILPTVVATDLVADLAALLGSRIQ